MKTFFFLVFSIVLSLSNFVLAVDYGAALGAMKQELTRSMKELRLEGENGPYYLGYRLTFSDSYVANCVHGAVGWEYELHQQSPFVEARVGSYELDNTWEGMATGESVNSGGSLEIDTGTIRHVYWFLSDVAYKNALRKYLDKKARLAQEFISEKLPDFSQEKPQSVRDLAEAVPAFDRGRLRDLCRKSSAEFRKYPELRGNVVRVEFHSEVRILATSEGTELLYETRHTPYSLFISAHALAPDGLYVDSFRSLRFRKETEIPGPEELSRLAAAVAGEVAALKRAPVQLPELTPALLDGESTGVFFHEALGHRLEGQRQREAGELQTFKGKVGQRIIPSFLNVYSDPRQKYLAQKPLSGHYLYDSQGVPAQRVDLVKEGVLKGYLMSRRPVSGFPHSNGSGRSDAESLAEGRMSVLVVEPRVGLKSADLRARFLEEIRKQGKPFGFRLVSMRSGEAQTTKGSSQSFVSRPRLIYRVAPDGTETLVRGLEYVGTPLSAIEKIVAAGSDAVPSNGFCGSDSGWVPVTEIAPSVILSELELQRQPEERFRPPVLKSPIFHE